MRDLSGPFLALFPDSNSQQLIGLIAWHGIIATSLLGGLIALMSPVLGGLILLAATGGWVALGYLLFGFSPQVVGPIGLSAIGFVASLAAIVRDFIDDRADRRPRPPSLEEMAREEALQLEPSSELRLAVERRAAAAAAAARYDEEDDRVAAPDPADAIRIAVPRVEQVRPAGLSGLFIANVTTLLLLTAAVGALFYINVRSGQMAAAFGTLPLASTAEPARTPSVEPEETPQAAAVPATPAPAPVKPVEVPLAEVKVSSTPLDLSALPVENWTDPFAYCLAVKTVDAPDRRYIGPPLTEPIAKALNVPENSAPDRARWRCYDGAVLGCASFRGASCALTPTQAEMREYCARNPNAQNLQAPNGTWSCIETTPEVPAGASWPTDPRGFLPGAWVEITPPVQPAG